MRVEISITAGPAKGHRFLFDRPDRFLFGRALDARVSLPNDPYVSRQHFLLEISPPDCKVTDLESKNGTFVNGVRYGGRKPAGDGIKQAPAGSSEVRLKNGDKIVVGDTHMQVAIFDTSPAAQHDATLSLAGGSVRDDETTNPLGILDKLLKEAVAPKQTANAPEVVVPKPGPALPVIEGYQVERLIDRGGMGMVYKAISLKNGQAVAIKVMIPHMATNPDNVNSFQREIDVTRQLRHPHIVQLHDHGKTNNLFYFVLEFVDGPNLFQLLENRGGTLSLNEVIPLMLRTLDGLAYAHHAQITMKIAGGQLQTFTGIVHRDLKPQNILLNRQGKQWFPKISDFGISKSFESAGFTNITKPGDVLGTPMYWPREQITHYKYLNPATDVFSAAAVFYELLTGGWVREGFDALFEKCKQQKRAASISDYMNVIVKNPAIPIRRRNPAIPEPVAAVLDQALREAEIPYDDVKMREALSQLRYPDAGAFRDALMKALQEAGYPADRLNALLPASGAAAGRANNQAAAVPPQPNAAPAPVKPAAPVSQDVSVFFSIIRPAATIEVALLVFDLKESSEHLRNMGDTAFSNVMANIYRRVKEHSSAADLVFLKSTGDGFLAVYNTVASAFALALTFLEKRAHQEIDSRMALHWGSVKTALDGDVIGVEVHRVFRMESIQMQDQIEPSDVPFPLFNRVVLTRQAMERLDAALQTQLTYAGKFLLKGFHDLCDLWVYRN